MLTKTNVEVNDMEKNGRSFYMYISRVNNLDFKDFTIFKKLKTITKREQIDLNTQGNKYQ